jgi:VacB/RNase II family 3'-5' exoribonuclease
VPKPQLDLAEAAHQEMIREGFHPDFPAETARQVAALEAQHEAHSAPPAADGIRDLRQLLWSSIDNDTSRDLDQIEYAERVAGGIRVLIGIADVDSDVPAGSPIDQHAASEATTVYTAVRIFPMIPEELSTNLTSLAENEDRLAIVIEFLVAPDGSMSGPGDVYRALVRNRAQLTYNGVGPWLEGRAAAPAKISSSPELAAQLKLQDEAACALRSQRHRLGALNFDRVEPAVVMSGGEIHDVKTAMKTRANDLIEDFMVAANETIARTLKEKGICALRRVVKSPERWPRIVELAGQHGERLPANPDSGALNAFLEKRRAADPVHYADVSLAVLKLMGPGEYAVCRPGDDNLGHFGLAASDYTHSTAPNRRFADLVTQRHIKSLLAKAPAPYSEPELEQIARNCTLREDAARKVERTMGKRVAAVAMQSRIGQSFQAVVTGVTPSGVFVRVPEPPIEGMLIRGNQGVDVGDQIRVELVSTDAQRGYIDFARS